MIIDFKTAIAFSAIPTPYSPNPNPCSSPTSGSGMALCIVAVRGRLGVASMKYRGT